MIEHMWRVPRRLAHVGIWCAESATALHNAICSLPVWRFTGISVPPPSDRHLTTDPESET